MKYDKLRQQLNTKLKGGEPVKAAIDVIRGLDRLEDNPFFPTEEALQRMLNEYGYLTFVVFVCPKMRSKYLDSNSPEKYMPVEADRNSLIFPRVPKLQALATGLWKVGIPTKLIFVIGDNGYDTYKGPPLGKTLNQEVLNDRRKRYLEDLESKLSKYFPQYMEVISLGLMEVGLYEDEVEIPSDMFQREVDFQRWTFEKYYAGNIPSEEVLEEIARLKILAYAEQGFLIEAADAILISTEGSNLDSWVQRTLMFMVSGASFASIYPYIRAEKLKCERR